MISFRYHVVTIVAVLVALAVGVLLGGTVLDATLANRLQGQVSGQKASLERTQAELAQQQDQIKRWERLGSDWIPQLLANRLTGVPVVLITEQGVDLPSIQAARQALTQAGVSGVVTIQLGARMGSSDPADQAELASIVGVAGASPPADLAGDAARALADRLIEAPALGVTDLLATLQSAGFLSVIGSAAAVGAAGQAVAVVTGGTPTAPVDPSSFLLPMMRRLLEHDQSTPIVVGEPTQTQDSFVSVVRRSDMNGKVVTVDDIETPFGQISLVVGMQNLILSPGSGANYGVGPGASAPFPAP